MNLDAFVNPLLDLVLAPVCLGCDGLINPGDTARLVCRRCRTLIKALPHPACKRCGAPILATGRSRTECCPECEDWPPVVMHARSACLLHPPADRLVHQLKYRGWRAVAEPMAERMSLVDMPVDEAHSPRICIPIPTTTARRRERGYNQAELLCRGYANRTGMAILDCLVRTGSRGTQTTLQPAARAANVAGAFALGRDFVSGAAPGAGYEVHGVHVLLIDDVLTTGATAVECAMTLAAAGACCVSILTYARALDTRRLIQT